MQGQCRAIKANGERRKGTATGPNGYCWAHDPKNAEHRRRTASKAGRSKPGREVKDLKKQLEDLAADVLSGRVDRGNAVAVNQIINTRARRMELERKIKETEELEERLEALEQIQEQKGGGRRWHA